MNNTTFDLNSLDVRSADIDVKAGQDVQVTPALVVSAIISYLVSKD